MSIGWVIWGVLCNLAVLAFGVKLFSGAWWAWMVALIIVAPTFVALL